MHIQVSSAKAAYGIQGQGGHDSIDLGQGSTIAVTSTGSSAYGVYLSDGGGSFKMDSGSIQATSGAGEAYGLL